MVTPSASNQSEVSIELPMTGHSLEDSSAPRDVPSQLQAMLESRQAERVRARIIQHFPGFAAYHWEDEHFNDSRESGGIVAVFDHDWSRSASEYAVAMSIFPLLLSLGIYITLCVNVFPDNFLSSPVQGVMFMLALFGIMTCGTCCFIATAYSELMRRLPSSPHTALTAHGVLHVEGGSFRSSSVDSYFFPFNNIRSIIVETSGEDSKTPTDTCRISMQWDLSAYRLESGRTPPSVPARTNNIRIRHLVDSKRFQEVVSFLKDGGV